MTLENIREKLEGVDSTKIFFTDLNGRPRNLLVNGEAMERIVAKGVGFDGSSIAGMATVDNSDRLLVPLPETFRLVEFPDEKFGFFMGKVNNERGERSRFDPRAVLERVLAEAEADFGLRFLLGPEYEFFLLEHDEPCEDMHTDKAGYFHPEPHDKGEGVRQEIVEVCSRCGVRYEKAHHEVTPSQHEINFECMDPLGAADRTVLFVHIAQKVAALNGLHATFMPKPFDGQNRNAFHIHLSAQDLNGRNAFHSPDAEHNLSLTARRFIAGVVRYARETSILMASTFNSYKAYVVEREAPVLRGWGLRNRSSMVRVPYCDSPDSTRIELRNPDATGNVYLQVAAFIAMGLQGLREELDCGPPDRGSAYKDSRRYRLWDERLLPKSMYEALVEAEGSRFLKDLLGEAMYDNYMALKTADWEEHRTHVTPREYRKYLMI